MRTLMNAGDPLPPGPGIDMPHGPLVRFLNDPNAFYADTWKSVCEFVTAWWPVAMPSAVAVSGAVLAARLVLRSRQRRVMAADARLIEVEVPPTVNPAAAEAFWSHLHALLRPTWRRLWSGQPHLVFEYRFQKQTATFGIWVPGVLPSTTVEAAIGAAWPGARPTRPAPAPP